MKMKRICLGIIFVLLSLMVLVGCQMEAPPAETALPSQEPEPSAPVDVEPVPHPVSGTPVYKVSTVDELLAALGPERIIDLSEGVYDLSSAADYGSGSSDAYYWSETYDGYELVINNVQNLHITGGDAETPQIVTRPRYANVLKFEDCDTVTLGSLILGHTEERGTCSGGVVYFDNCDEMTVSFCRLYGCGTIGITAINCSGVYAMESFIYDCSQNAVFASSCHDVQIRHSVIHDNGVDWSQGLFYAEGCNGFAVINCEIYDNFAANLVYASYSQQLNMLGCRVRQNSFTDSLFHAEGYSPTVDMCSFDENGDIPAFSQLPALDPRGNELSSSDIEGMEWMEAHFSGIKEAAPVELDETVNADGIREVTVTTVDEFLAAIDSNTVIKLEGELFDLSAAADYGAYGTENYYWVNVFDGPGLVINNVYDLSIVSDTGSSIVAQPRYADVLRFLNCEDITLSGITAGHTQAPGECAGGVLAFENCWDMDIENCRLYGCGTWGIEAFYSSELSVRSTEIYDCSIGAIALYTVMDAGFESMDVHGCPAPELTLHDCMDVTYEGAALDYGDWRLESGLPVRYEY